MKTMNSKTEETGLSALTVLIACIATIFSLNVSGAMLENSMKSTTKMNALSALLAEETETAGTVENWMLNKDNFYHDYRLEAATETPLTLESWMTGTNLFPSFADLQLETEEILHMEDWMLNDSLFVQSAEEKTEPEILAQAEPAKRKRVIGVTFEKAQFGRRAFIIIEEDDPTLNMEQWMLDYRHWNKK